MLKSPPQIAEATSTAVATIPAISAAVAIPTKFDGSPAKYVLVTSASFGSLWNTGDSTVAADLVTSVVLGANHSYIFNVSGATHFACIRISSAGQLSVSPLENM